MADTPRCTCPAHWHGRGQRPPCALHEADCHPADDLAPGQARRRDGTVVDVMATLAHAPGPERDAEGMGSARSWRPFP